MRECVGASGAQLVQLGSNVQPPFRVDPVRVVKSPDPECSQGITGRIHPLLPHGRGTLLSAAPNSAFVHQLSRARRENASDSDSAAATATSPAPQKRVLITLLWTRKREREGGRRKRCSAMMAYLGKSSHFSTCALAQQKAGSRGNRDVPFLLFLI